MESYMKTEPYAHQSECLEISKDRASYAIFLEQGLGKTKVVLDNAAYLWFNEQIKGLLVVAPNGVHSNWVRREIPAHLSEDTDYLGFEYDAHKRKNKTYQRDWKEFLRHEGLVIMTVNIEALSSSKRAREDVQKFLKGRRCMMVVDESSRIKTPKSNRSKTVKRLGKLAPFRRILTGTPVTQSPFDLFSQFQFLDPSLLGFKSYFVFKHHYGVFEKGVGQRDGKMWQYETLLRYVRLDDLKKRIGPHSFRRTKLECLDLPEKIYQVVNLKLSPAQRNLYNRMDEHGILEFADFEVLAAQQITKLLRLQQITGGFISTENMDPTGLVHCESIPGPNPKLNYLLETLEEECVGKTIIWARFRFEIALIVENLKLKYGQTSVVQLHGGVTGENREESVNRFQTDDSCRFLIGQQQSGIGITLHAAQYVFYYSNPFSYEQRYQSEDRAHRIGLKHPVVYIDLVMDETVDERVREVLRKSHATANIITGDNKRRKK